MFEIILQDDEKANSRLDRAIRSGSQLEVSSLLAWLKR